MTYIYRTAPDTVLVLVLPGITLWRPGVHPVPMKNTLLYAAVALAPVLIRLSYPGQGKSPPQATRRPACRAKRTSYVSVLSS